MKEESCEKTGEVKVEFPALSNGGFSVATPEGRLVVPDPALEAKAASVCPSLVAELRRVARESAGRAYAPYSKFPVGAALVMADDPEGRIFGGCNVENSALGGTICAERNAIFGAVAAGWRKLGLLLVSTVDSLDGPLRDRSPCGPCRQVIREFADENTLIVVDGGNADVLGEFFDIDRLLPSGFVHGN